MDCGHEGLEEFRDMKRCPRCGSETYPDGSVGVNPDANESVDNFDKSIIEITNVFPLKILKDEG